MVLMSIVSEKAPCFKRLQFNCAFTDQQLQINRSLSFTLNDIIQPSFIHIYSSFQNLHEFWLCINENFEGFYFCCCYFPLIECFVGFLKLVSVWFGVCVCVYGVVIVFKVGFFADENGNILQIHKGVTLRIIEASKSHFS